MIKFLRGLTVFLLSFATSAVMAQVSTATTSSPYSRYGVGNIVQPWAPQNLAMGGVSVATNQINGYMNINFANPASYAFIGLTTIDVGMSSNFVTLSKTGATDQKNSNFTLSHVAFAFPVSKHSALSFGLMPYSELGYRYTQTLSRGFGTTSPADTNVVNYIYSGQGGLSKAYMGYGFNVGKHLSVGANVSYIFGSLKQFSSTELPNLYGTYNSRQELDNSIGGVNYDFGLQYTIPVADDKRFTLGYSGSASTSINSQTNYIVTQYTTDFTTDEENNALDTLVRQKNPVVKLKLPSTNRFGFAYQYDRKFLIGADYTMSNWSSSTIGGVSQGLENSNSLSIGGQFNPNSNSLHSYLDVVDYRLGAHFDKTYVVVNNQSINQTGITFGLGLPLIAKNGSFYKVNISGEVGQRGTLSNSLVKETYFNLHLSFMLNDRWFVKYKFD